MDHTRRAEEVVSDLFVALKTCQQDYGNGSRKVATESDARVRQLLEAWLSLFSHGLSPTLCRSQFPCAWFIVTSLISSDEVSRFNQYENDERRLNAWLRHTLNDRIFDKYLRLLLSNRSLIQKYYEPWSAISLLSADPSALIHLTSGCLASVVFDLRALESSSTMPVAVPYRPAAQSLASVSSAVSASSYNDVLSAWAAGSSQDIGEDNPNADSTMTMQPFGQSFEGSSGLVPLPSTSVSSGEPLPAFSINNPSVLHQSSSRQSLYSSPTQGGGVLAENSDSSESVGRLSSNSGGIGSGAVSANLATDTPPKSAFVERDNRSALSLPFVSSPNKPAKRPTSKEASDEYSYTELKQLLLNVLQEKQALEKSNRDLETKVVEYRDRLVELESSVDNLRRREADLISTHQLRISASAKENDILKQQLKKYIAQLQSQNQGQANLTNGGDDSQLAGSSTLAERKVVELSEMHGELLEFVEKLQAKLRSKETRLTNYRRQLTALRGPLPPESEDEGTEETGKGGRSEAQSSAARQDSITSLPHQPSGSSSANQLIHVWVPLVFLKAAGNPHHIYQIYLRLRDDEWNVFRRYSELLAFHQALRRRYPAAVGKVPFPPKKSVGNRKPEFVEARRQQLQTYLRTTFDMLTKSQPEFARLTRAKLLLLLPFLDERCQPSPTAAGIGIIGAGSPGQAPALSTSLGTGSIAPRETGRTYAGL